MKATILKHSDCLVASIQSALTDAEALDLQRDLVRQVSEHRARGVIVDVTGLDAMDSYATRLLRETAQMVRLRGAEMVIVGIQPEVAFAMVQMGLHKGCAETALDLEEGLSLLARKRMGKKTDGAWSSLGGG